MQKLADISFFESLGGSGNLLLSPIGGHFCGNALCSVMNADKYGIINIISALDFNKSQMLPFYQRQVALPSWKRPMDAERNVEETQEYISELQSQLGSFDLEDIKTAISRKADISGKDEARRYLSVVKTALADLYERDRKVTQAELERAYGNEEIDQATYMERWYQADRRCGDRQRSLYNFFRNGFVEEEGNGNEESVTPTSTSTSTSTPPVDENASPNTEAPLRRFTKPREQSAPLPTDVPGGFGGNGTGDSVYAGEDISEQIARAVAGEGDELPYDDTKELNTGDPDEVRRALYGDSVEGEGIPATTSAEVDEMFRPSESVDSSVVNPSSGSDLGSATTPPISPSSPTPPLISASDTSTKKVGGRQRKSRRRRNEFRSKFGNVGKERPVEPRNLGDVVRAVEDRVSGARNDDVRAMQKMEGRGVGSSVVSPKSRKPRSSVPRDSNTTVSEGDIAKLNSLAKTIHTYASAPSLLQKSWDNFQAAKARFRDTYPKFRLAGRSLDVAKKISANLDAVEKRIQDACAATRGFQATDYQYLQKLSDSFVQLGQNVNAHF